MYYDVTCSGPRLAPSDNELSIPLGDGGHMQMQQARGDLSNCDPGSEVSDEEKVVSHSQPDSFDRQGARLFEVSFIMIRMIHCRRWVIIREFLPSKKTTAIVIRWPKGILSHR